MTAHLTGRDPIFVSQGEAGGPSVLTEALIGAAGALVILLFVFGTLPAVAMPLMIAIVSIMTTFASLYVLTFDGKRRAGWPKFVRTGGSSKSPSPALALVTVTVSTTLPGPGCSGPPR